MQEKKAIKEEKMKQEEKYTWAVVDGVKEKVNYFSSTSFSKSGSLSVVIRLYTTDLVNGEAFFSLFN